MSTLKYAKLFGKRELLITVTSYGDLLWKLQPTTEESLIIALQLMAHFQKIKWQVYISISVWLQMRTFHLIPATCCWEHCLHTSQWKIKLLWGPSYQISAIIPNADLWNENKCAWVRLMPKPLNNGYCLSNFRSGEITARYSLTKWDTALLKCKEQENLF